MTDRDPFIDAAAFAARRAQDYTERWSEVWNRLTTTEYRSEHMLDDVFSLYGMWVKDATAAGAWMSRMWGVDPRALDDRRDHGD